MGRRFTDTEKVSQHRVKQKNGDIYVYERTYKYNQQTKKTERVGNRLIGKICPGSDEIVPTRPKQRSGVQEESRTGIVSANRTRRMLTDILDWAGRASGIDDDLRDAMDEGSALKTISLARFLVATDGATVPHIEAWQLTHPIPYTDGLSNAVCYALFRSLGADETSRQRFFRARAQQLECKPLIAFDSTSISTWSELQEEARYGYNKAGDGLKTIKFTTIYAAKTRQPIAFGKQPGDLPDVTGLLVLLRQMEVLGLRDPQIVTDNGYWSEANVMEMCREHLDFITLSKPTIGWIRSIAEDALKDLHSPANLEEGVGGVYVTTRRVKHAFSYQRRYASTKKNLQAGDTEEFSRRLYLHICLDPIRKEQADVRFTERIRKLKQDLLHGVPLTEMKAAAQKDAHKYLTLRYAKDDSIKSADWNIEACNEACRFHGVFVIVASREKDGFDALRKYRQREKIEEFFKLSKDDTDGERPRVWHADTLMGRMLVQFAALCYADFLRLRIKKMKDDLEAALSHADEEGKSHADLKTDKSLLAWLNKTSFNGILEWFDAYEDIEVSEAIRARRWNPQTTKRDRRFLSLLLED